MKTREARWPIQLFRIASLVAPAAVAWDIAFSAPHPSLLTEAVTYALGPLWLLVAGALLFRCADALVGRARGRAAAGVSLLDRIDVLTASGSATLWLGAIAIAASVWLGWASLSVVGLMGIGLVSLVVLWTCLRAGGEDPFRRASVSRRFVPERAVEGAPVTEEVRLAGVRIPAGFRLFASGRVGPRWPVSRYVIEDDGSGGEILLESDLGPALRGDHHAEPLELWLQDMFGLCRSARVPVGEARLTVLPRAREIDGARHLLGPGGSDQMPRPARRLPTEGSLRLREYQPGDDARRIHWMRSLSARQPVVRLPDELPPDLPDVRLVLDTFLPGAEALCCTAPDDLLDALVAVWIGVGRALAAAGVRVTLVTAAPGEGKTAAREERLTRHAPAPALRLGAEVVWQDALAVEGLLGDGAAIVVSCRLQPDPSRRGPVRWIVVPKPLWTTSDTSLPVSASSVLPYPLGSADNRASRRRSERLRRERALRDEARFARLCLDTAAPREGTFVARPTGKGRIRVEAIAWATV